MASAAVTEFKNGLSHFLRLVRRGESVTVLERGRPVARLVPLSGSDREIDDLIAAGLAAPAGRPLDEEFLARDLPQSTESVAGALAADRDDRF